MRLSINGSTISDGSLGEAKKLRVACSGSDTLAINKGEKEYRNKK